MFKRLILRQLKSLREAWAAGIRLLDGQHLLLLQRVEEVVAGIKDLQEREKHMSKVVDDLVVQVKSLRGVVDSADALMAKLFALIQGAIDTGDVTKVQAALDDIKAQQADLANAVAANTPPTTPTP